MNPMIPYPRAARDPGPQDSRAPRCPHCPWRSPDLAQPAVVSPALPFVLLLLAGGLSATAGCNRKQPPAREGVASPPGLLAGSPARRAAFAGREAYSEAAWAAKEAEVRALVGPGFTLVRSPPFLVAGDESAPLVRGHAERTVAWATQLLKKQYFPKDPPQILTVYLFGDASSYERHVKKLLGREPSTPYGFYSESAGALMMNIATGGGTLVHEMVHPFMAANFPGVPAWFNEGMGSLYEQCEERDGEIRGLTNWRLAGLQQAIRKGVLGSTRALLATTTEGFYGEDSGSNYAQARYLCFYLQEHGLLGRFYRAFHFAAASEDPAKRDATGYETLRKILGPAGKDMAAFDREFRSWVLTLRFP